MRLEGRHPVALPREEVFEKLMDPRLLARAIPGCEELVLRPDGAYDARLSVGIGPIKGSFTGKVVLKDVLPPGSYTMEIEGTGRAGFLKGLTRVRLDPIADGRSTEVHYESEVQVGGLLATVGSRLLPGVARGYSEQFFQRLEQAIREEGRA